MTTGTRFSGVSGSEFYAFKTWSGADGKYATGHVLKHNNYSMSAVRRTRSKGIYCITFFQGKCLRWSSPAFIVDCNIIGANPWTNNHQLALMNKLAVKIKGSDFQLGTFIATGSQAVQQTVSTIRAIGMSVNRLRKLDISGALTALGQTPGQRRVKEIGSHLRAGDISGAWLAMQYGWLPTLSDIFSAWKGYEVRCSPTRKMSFTATLMAAKAYNGSSAPSLYTCDSVRAVSRRVTVELRELPTPGRVLGLTDPLSIAWEVTPWSFVVDWFLPIGSYLEALNFIPSLSGASGQTTIKDRTLSAFANANNVAYAGSCGNDSSESISLTRGSADLSIPTPNFVPVLDAMSPARIFNAVALAHQQFLHPNLIPSLSRVNSLVK